MEGDREGVPGPRHGQRLGGWNLERGGGGLWGPQAGPGPLTAPARPGDGRGAVLPAPVRHQAADQQGLHRRHHRQGPLHAQRGVAAAGEH